MLSDQEIFDAVQPHLPRKGHAYIWDTDPEYAKSVGIEVGTRWIVGEMHPEHTLAASRAVESAACAERDARIAELERELEEARRKATEDAYEFNRAINFAIEQGLEACHFLAAWREGDPSGWPEFDAAIKEQT